MKKFYSILVLVIVLNATTVFGQSFSWSNHPSGHSSSSVNNGGITRSFNINGSGISNGYPAYNANGGGNLATNVNWSNKNSSATMVIEFSKPLAGITFLLFDVDQSSTWDDKLTITATGNTDQTIYPTLTGNSYTSISGTHNNIIEGTANNANYSNSPAMASFGMQYVKKITIVFSAGSSSPNNPASQVVGIGGIVYENVLPVTLTAFRADKKNTTTDLKWQTENQENFSHFEVERSSTGNDDFETIGKVSATGTTSGSYNFTDANGARLAQKAYYRLKMVDIDGQYKYSPVNLVTFENAPSVMVTPTLVAAGQNVNVNIAGTNQTRFDVKLFDMSGKQISQQSGNGRMQITTSGLRKGMYIVAVSNGTEISSTRIMVQ